jgi:benzoyl-CoA reductase/2-hydroxyglutaryl-CoA dehydratase subunit BcrC/BadD/HgdB
MDTRNFAEGQLRTRIEAFVEMLETRPHPWQ